MKVRETLKIEMDALIEDLVRKIDIPSDATELSVNEVFDLAEAQGCFNQKDYVYSNDEDTLVDLLVFSLGLSNLYTNYKKDNPDAVVHDVNFVIIDYMKHMWGLEKVPTLKAGRTLESESE